MSFNIKAILFLIFLLSFQGLFFSPIQAALPCECLEDRILTLTDPPMAGYDILLLQERLAELTYYHGPLNGIYSVELAKAVASFQEENQLEVDGEVGPSTWAALAGETMPAAGDEKRKGPQGEITIEVDTYSRVLTLYVDGKVFKRYPVAIGKPSTKSPVGEWAIISKSKDWGDGFGTRWLGLNVPWGIYGIHGTNKSWSIGRAESQGCIRMYNRDVEELYELVPLKTRVKIIGQRLPVKVNRPLKPGQMGLSVMQLQDNLLKIGIESGYRDARYGETTEAAVRELEAQFQLKLDGIADWNVLYLLDLPG
ncbi:MAG: L,D-transpeptidase family protein [Halanaerobiaceae bacterium]|nr:L,D-transpeptidase family protein [Halanaerobiaceae bacterium]